MKIKIPHLTILLILLTNCTSENVSQSNDFTKTQGTVGGGCDGCELMYIDMPDHITSVDTSPGWDETGQKLILRGTVYQLDAKTPAADVIVYYWHTDNTGYYASKPDLNPKARSHGYLRGWIKTDETGQYAIYTIRPAPYPNDELPAHIHLSVKESNIENEYYTDDIVFDDDPLLLANFKKYPPQNRGGNGVVKVSVQNGIQVAKHDIILGLNIPHYPE